MSICATCRRTLLARVSIRTRPSPRYASTVPSTPNAAPSEPTMPFSKAEFSAVKPITIQPLSTPDADPPSNIKKAAKAARKSTDLQGSIPGGEELRGMGYTKAKPRVLAKEDTEYPEWLWALLDEKTTELGTSKVDLNAMTRKQRHRHDKKQEKLRSKMPKQIPLHEQSKDLPADNAMDSLQARRELTKSARDARRKGIREANFLRSM